MRIRLSKLRQIIKETLDAPAPQKSHWENWGSGDSTIDELIEDGTYYPPEYYATRDFSLVKGASLQDAFDILGIPTETQNRILDKLYAKDDAVSDSIGYDTDDLTKYVDVSFDESNWNTDLAVE